MESRLRAERRRIFRLYLKHLGRDFGKLHYALRLMVIHAPHDRPDLAKTLIKQKLVFMATLAAVHFHLVLYRFGIGGVNVRGLISTLETMQQELRAMMTPMAASTNAA